MRLREDIILMDKEDRRRLHLIQQAIEKNATQQEAAEVLELSDRILLDCLLNQMKPSSILFVHQNNILSQSHALLAKDGMLHQIGHFYFGRIGHYHCGITLWLKSTADGCGAESRQTSD